MNYFHKSENLKLILIFFTILMGSFFFYFCPANYSPVNWLHRSWTMVFFQWSDFLNQHYRTTNLNAISPVFSPLVILSKSIPLLLLLPLTLILLLKRFYFKSIIDLKILCLNIPLLFSEPLFFFILLPCLYWREYTGISHQIGKFLIMPISLIIDLPVRLLCLLFILVNLLTYALFDYFPIIDSFTCMNSSIFRNTFYFTTIQQNLTIEKVIPVLGLWVFFVPLVNSSLKRRSLILVLIIITPLFLMDQLNRAFYFSLLLCYFFRNLNSLPRTLWIALSSIFFLCSLQVPVLYQNKPVKLFQNRVIYVLPASTPGNEFVFKEFNWTMIKEARIKWADLQWIPESSSQAKKILKTQGLDKLYRNGFDFYEKEKIRQLSLLKELEKKPGQGIIFLVSHDQTYNIVEKKPYTVGYKFRQMLCTHRQCKVIWNSSLK
jgi:hypothetical protein